MNSESSPDNQKREEDDIVFKPTSSGLVWMITAGQGILLGTLVWIFSEYWMMLPVRYRWAGILILSTLAGVLFLRLFLFYRRARCNRQKPPSL